MLPSLTDEPQHFPHCCFGLSTLLFWSIQTRIVRLLPTDGLILSVGSGSGLLEAHLHKTFPSLNLQVIEVASSVNKYMPTDLVHLVGGTWDLCSIAPNALALLFVYPREPSLVSRYLQECRENARIVLWLGPRVDWPDYLQTFENSAFSQIEEAEDCGIAPFEMMVVMTQPK